MPQSSFFFAPEANRFDSSAKAIALNSCHFEVSHAQLTAVVTVVGCLFDVILPGIAGISIHDWNSHQSVEWDGAGIFGKAQCIMEPQESKFPAGA